MSLWGRHLKKNNITWQCAFIFGKCQAIGKGSSDGIDITTCPFRTIIPYECHSWYEQLETALPHKLTSRISRAKALPSSVNEPPDSQRVPFLFPFRNGLLFTDLPIHLRTCSGSNSPSITVHKTAIRFKTTRSFILVSETVSERVLLAQFAFGSGSHNEQRPMFSTEDHFGSRNARLRFESIAFIRANARC